MKRKLLSFLLSLIAAGLLCAPALAAAPDADTVLQTAAGIVAYKKAQNGVPADGNLLSGELLRAAGTTAGDWYPFGMAALGLTDGYGDYLASLRDNVRERYGTNERLSASKATEWHRVILAAMACGADPTRFVTANGETVDLVSDGVFLRERLDRQGINGYIWALIVLNAYPFAAPENAVNTKESILGALLSLQKADGGWTMAGNTYDTDITAMTLIALSPFYTNDPAARAAADRALTLLSGTQLPDGGFAETGISNCESCAVVLTTLCCMGIDPCADARFIKNGNTVYGALLRYRLENGAFTHAFTADADDPTAVPNEPNDMACQQALYALAAYRSFLTGGGSIFDFSGKTLSAEGFDAEPETAGALENAANAATERVKSFFADQTNRRTVIGAVLAVIAAAALTGVILRRRRKKRE